jgi:hypothetical protein
MKKVRSAQQRLDGFFTLIWAIIGSCLCSTSKSRPHLYLDHTWVFFVI